MVPRPPFSKHVLRMIKIMTDGRSVDVISGNFSWHLLALECYFFPILSFTWGPSWPFSLLRCCFWKYLINSHRKMRHFKRRSNAISFGGRTSVSEPALFSGKYFTCFTFYSNLHKNWGEQTFFFSKILMRPKAPRHFNQKTWREFRWFSDRSYDFMKNQ